MMADCNFRRDFRQLPPNATSANANPQKSAVCGTRRKLQFDLFDATSADQAQTRKEPPFFAAEVAAEVVAEVGSYISPYSGGERPKGLSPACSERSSAGAEQTSGRVVAARPGAEQARAEDEPSRPWHEPEGEGQGVLEAPELEAVAAEDSADRIAYRQQVAADLAAGAAIVAGATDWQDACRRMHAAGRMSAFTARALGVIE